MVVTRLNKACALMRATQKWRSATASRTLGSSPVKPSTFLKSASSFAYAAHASISMADQCFEGAGIPHGLANETVRLASRMPPRGLGSFPSPHGPSASHAN